MYRLPSTIKTLAIILGTTVEMLMDYAHSQGFNWVNEESEVFIIRENGTFTDFQFFQRKAK